MTNVIDMLNAALDELRTTLIERDRTIRELNEHIGLQQSTIEQQYSAIELQSTTILNLRAQAGHLSKDHTPPINVTVPMLQHLSDRVAELERNLEAMKKVTDI